MVVHKTNWALSRWMCFPLAEIFHENKHRHAHHLLHLVSDTLKVKHHRVFAVNDLQINLDIIAFRCLYNILSLTVT